MKRVRLCLPFVRWFSPTLRAEKGHRHGGGAAAIAGLCCILTAGSAEPAQGGGAETLRLSIRVEPAAIVTGEEVRLEATLKDVGTHPVKVFKPRYHDIIAASDWRIRRTDGTLYSIHELPFQSGLFRGIQGEIVTLSPNEGRSTALTMKLVTTTLFWTGFAGDPTPLPPGRYSVSCAHEKPDNLVPFIGEDDFRRTQKPVDGLWTGSIESDTITLNVLPSRKPSLLIRALPNPSEGDPYVLHGEITNDTDTPASLRGTLILNLASGKLAAGAKASRPCMARFYCGPPPEPGRRRTVSEFYVPAHSKGTFSVDVTTLNYLPHELRDMGQARGFYDAALTGLGTQLWVDLVDEEGTVILQSNDMVRVVRSREVRSAPDLRLEVLPLPQEGLAWPLLQVQLVNVGQKPIRVPSRLAFPIDVSFELRSLDEEVRRNVKTHPHSRHSPEPNAAVPRGLWWHRNAFENPPPMARSEFRLLPPGGTLRRIFDLTYLIGGTPSEDRYELRAYWHVFETGRRFGLEDPPAEVGTLWSTPVIIEVGEAPPGKVQNDAVPENR